jgi:probable HAF family extracellular repeat protein
MPDFAQEISPWTEALRASLSRLEYHIQNLAGPPGSRNPAAFGLSESGVVAGKAYMHLTGLMHGDTGVTWTAGLYDVVLPPTVGLVPSPSYPLPAYGSGFSDISLKGVAVGWREHDDATGGDIAIEAVGTNVSDIPWEKQARATDINDDGLICGWSGGTTSTRAFIYDPANLPPRHVGLPGATRSRAMAINNLGEVAGDSDGQAFLYSGGKAKPLGLATSAVGMNDTGIVVGTHAGPLGDVPALCDARRPIPAWTAIPLPARFAGGRAEAVNRFGHVVGECRDKSGLRCAFIYKDGLAYDLNLLIDEPGWQLEIATDINDRGQICGNGTFMGQAAAWLLTPPLVLPELPPRHRKWPLKPTLGGPDEVTMRDASLLLGLHQAATSLANPVLRERVRTALVEAGRQDDAGQIAADDDVAHPSAGARRRSSKPDASAQGVAALPAGEAIGT